LLKIALGTVQFGTGYGIANTSGQVPFEEARRIVFEAAAHGADTVDTAIAYGESEAVLGRIGVDGWKVITKLPAAPSLDRDVCAWVERELLNSLERLRVSRLYGVLLHQPSQLLEPGGTTLAAALEQARKMGIVDKIGLSIYAPEQLAALLAVGTFDLVQAPFNILDRRLSESGWAAELKARGIEIHARSIFLQGLLTMQGDRRPEKFRAWNSVWNAWERWLDEVSISPVEACMRFAMASEHIDRVVIGIDNVAQARQIFGVETSALPSLPTWPPLFDQRLINPAQWNEL
jgi:aryl-alcohol dehydrogenase-like predicted oxidoreductase